jgi:hypothetical protein
MLIRNATLADGSVVDVRVEAEQRLAGDAALDEVDHPGLVDAYAVQFVVVVGVEPGLLADGCDGVAVTERDDHVGVAGHVDGGRLGDAVEGHLADGRHGDGVGTRIGVGIAALGGARTAREQSREGRCTASLDERTSSHTRLGSPK